MNKRFQMSNILMGLYSSSIKMPLDYLKGLLFESKSTKIRSEPKGISRANGNWFHKSFNNQQLIGKLMYFRTKQGKKLYRIISRDDKKQFSYRLESLKYVA